MKRQITTRSLIMWPGPDRCRILGNMQHGVDTFCDVKRNMTSHLCINEHHVGSGDVLEAGGAKNIFQKINQKKAHKLEQRRSVGPVLCGDVNAVDSDGWTLLFYAIHYGQTGTARELLETGCDVMVQDKRGDTPLHVAVRRGRQEIARLILSQEKVQLNLRNKDGQTPFMLSVSLGNMDFVHLLHKHGADINICDDKDRSPMYLSLERGLVDIADFLLDKHCDVTREQPPDRTCFYAASHNPNVNVSHFTRRLLKEGYDFRMDKDWLLTEGCPNTLQEDSTLHNAIMVGAGIIPDVHKSHQFLETICHETNKIIRQMQHIHLPHLSRHRHLSHQEHHHHHHHHRQKQNVNDQQIHHKEFSRDQEQGNFDNVNLEDKRGDPSDCYQNQYDRNEQNNCQIQQHEPHENGNQNNSDGGYRKDHPTVQNLFDNQPDGNRNHHQDYHGISQAMLTML